MMPSSGKFSFISSIAISFAALLLPAVACANYQFVHDSGAVQLGPAGVEMTVSFSIDGLRQTDIPVDVEIIRDGRLTYLTAQNATFNIHEQPTYTFALASPKAGIVYRFRFQDGDGKTWISDYYWAIQQCQDRSTPSQLNGKFAGNDESTEEILQLAIKAEELEKKLLRHGFIEKKLLQFASMLEGSVK